MEPVGPADDADHRHHHAAGDVLVGLLYVFVATIIAFWIGRPIIRLSFDNEKFNAAFRYALVRLRDAAEAVAFYRGEAAERLQLRRRFTPVVSTTSTTSTG